MPLGLVKNEIFDMAVQFVNNTNRNIFLTGKAGSGKTTFLKHIKEISPKKLVVIAPTGVAAINAGGVTIHSFFQLPFGSFLPAQTNVDYLSGNFYNRYNLLKSLRFSQDKSTLIKELELLIIDEVSMVRADLLDAIDVVLKSVRKQPHLPFGGVQMLFIGDLYQLPPVTSNYEWQILQKFYESPFFFHAHTLRSDLPLYIELKKIYRQNDAAFLELLNKIRNNNIQEADLLFINKYYNPEFKAEGEKYIVLTSHNLKADSINHQKLKSLEGKIYTFQAEVTGDFNEKSIPAEPVLFLKEGAQVMFIKNEKGELKRYYNGKIGTIKRIDEEGIFVVFPENDSELLVEREVWQNIRYKYNKEDDFVEEEVIGTCTQYPLRLAWAITIHKSQGLTFEKAIIDAGESFAAGQVYVALSRLTSLKGLVLYSKINQNCINTDKQAIAFTKTELQVNDLQNHLKHSQKLYLHNLMLQVFNWRSLIEVFENFNSDLDERRIPHQDEAKAVAQEVLTKLKELGNTGQRFIEELKSLLKESEKLNNYEQLKVRLEAAEHYFNTKLETDAFIPLKEHYNKIKSLPKVKKYKKDLQDLTYLIKQKRYKLEQVLTIISGFTAGKDPVVILQESIQSKKAAKAATLPLTKQSKTKLPKGASQRLSLAMFKEGKSMREIANERGFASSTIEGHLLSFIETGDIEVTELVEKEKIKEIQKVIEELKDEQISYFQIKEILGETYSYAEIKAVVLSGKTEINLSKS